jgi:phosphate starvation-inducible PhoH-like protein
VTGDSSQKDLAPGMKSGLDVAQKVLAGIENIEFCVLTDRDVVRHPLVAKIVRAYDEYEAKQSKSSIKKNEISKELGKYDTKYNDKGKIRNKNGRK